MRQRSMSTWMSLGFLNCIHSWSARDQRTCHLEKIRVQSQWHTNKSVWMPLCNPNRHHSFVRPKSRKWHRRRSFLRNTYPLQKRKSPIYHSWPINLQSTILDIKISNLLFLTWKSPIYYSWHSKKEQTQCKRHGSLRQVETCTLAPFASTVPPEIPSSIICTSMLTQLHERAHTNKLCMQKSEHTIVQHQRP